ncbi:hypothetical protein B8W72_07395 [Pseudomonas putida]|uniref:Uncharacterized protein n=1 Tax=Pseudomonas putida TaxID=303 RepID=A0A1Y3LD55_PSEPU|nr:hypothetical protein B8W72_07395 [Pseudomonas putida]
MPPWKPAWRLRDRPRISELTRSLWERACPRNRHRGGWHGLRPCSRRFDASTRPLPQGPR